MVDNKPLKGWEVNKQRKLFYEKYEAPRERGEKEERKGDGGVCGILQNALSIFNRYIQNYLDDTPI
jgi:hypothetical protein